MKFNILKSTPNRSLPLIVTVVDNRGKITLYKLAGQATVHSITKRTQAAYFQEFASRILRKIKVLTPVNRVVKVKSVYNKYFNKVEKYKSYNDRATFKQGLEFLMNKDINAIMLKSSFIYNATDYARLFSDLSIRACELAGKIGVGEFLLGVLDRHTYNYLGRKKGDEINNLWTIDLEASDLDESVYNRIRSALIKDTITQILKTEQLDDDEAFFKGVRKTKELIIRKENELKEIALNYSDILPSKLIRNFGRKIKLIKKIDPIELAFNINYKVYGDYDNNYLFKDKAHYITNLEEKYPIK